MTMTVPKPIVSMIRMPYSPPGNNRYYLAIIPVIGYEVYYRDIRINIIRGVQHSYISLSRIRLELSHELRWGHRAHWLAYIHLSGEQIIPLDSPDFSDAQNELRRYIRHTPRTLNLLASGSRIMRCISEVVHASPYTTADGKPVDLTDPPPHESVVLRIPDTKLEAIGEMRHPRWPL